MRVPISWLREFAPIPESVGARDLSARLIAAGLEVETVDVVGSGTQGPVVVGRVEHIEELTEFKKPIRFCRLSVGSAHGHPDTPGLREIICGAANFVVGDLVVVALPGATLPGGFEITSRKTYGRTSDGMICAERELGLGDDGSGIMVLPAGSAQPGDDALALLGIGEEVLDIAVTPDRGYALSIRGVAREAATAYDVPFSDPGLELPDLPPPAQEVLPHEGTSADPSACDLFTLRTITGFNPHASTPVWMRRRLIAGGMRSVNLAVDVTNYVMLECGQPLHAFDLDSLRGPVVARRANPGEELETLDHVARTLDPDDVVISDDTGAIGLAGTMGGLTSEIRDDSVNIALEAAHFDARSVARMSRRHKLSSEASRRFERGVDRMVAPIASARATALLLELGGGVYQGMTGFESASPVPTIEISATLPGDVAGMPISADTVVEKLREVGCDVARADGRLSVTAPSWRPDLTDPYDLVEEVVRLVGYDHIPSVLPIVPPHEGWSDERRLTRRVGLAMAGAGFAEVPAYPFIGADDLDALQLPDSDPRRATVRLANPLSDAAPLLRTTLLPGLIATAKRNLSRGAAGLALFEVGSVFLAAGAAPALRPDVNRAPSSEELAALDALLPQQPQHLAVLLAGERAPDGFWGQAHDYGWADAVNAARISARCIQASIRVERGGDPVFHPGRCAQLIVAGAAIGSAGELHPRVIEAYGLPARTCAMELDLGALIAAASGITPAPVIGTMPVAKEDIALIVPSDVPVASLRDVLLAAGGELLESVRLFDEYSGAQIEPGKRSVAFSLRFRAPDRTLTAEEVAAARQAAVAAAEAEFGATLRG